MTQSPPNRVYHSTPKGTPLLKYLTGSQLRIANGLARKAGYDRQLEDVFVRSLPARAIYLIATARSQPTGCVRCVVTIDADHDVTLDVDPRLYASLDEIRVPSLSPSLN